MKEESIPYTIPVYKLQLVQEGTATAMPVTGPAELAFHLKEIATADREHMVVIFLDTKNRPIGRQVVSIGTLNATLVHPREVFKAALIVGGSGANAVIIGHNHPSGDLTPSREDDDVTRKIARAGAYSASRCSTTSSSARTAASTHTRMTARTASMEVARYEDHTGNRPQHPAGITRPRKFRGIVHQVGRRNRELPDGMYFL